MTHACVRHYLQVDTRVNTPAAYREQARIASISMFHEANTRRKSGGSVSKCMVCSAKQTALPAIWQQISQVSAQYTDCRKPL